MFRRVVVGVALFSLLTVPAAAATVAGGSGLINMPNADALRTSSLEAGAHFFGNVSVLSLNVGLVPQVEAGVNTDTFTNNVGFTVKGVLSPEARDFPGIAVGLENNSAYVVMSRSFSGFRGHVGFGTGRFDGPFAGASWVLNPVTVSKKGASSPVTTLLAEYDGHNLNAGARVAFTSQLKVDFALVDLSEPMLGVSFNTSL